MAASVDTPDAVLAAVKQVIAALDEDRQRGIRATADILRSVVMTSNKRATGTGDMALMLISAKLAKGPPSMALPEPIHSTKNYIYAAYEKEAAAKNEGSRMHLGASEIGKRCARMNWYSFRWALKSVHEGRMLRLFRRGHREEAEVFADLRRAGIEVHDLDANGNQYRFAMWGGHFAGSFDAVAKGFPEAPTTWHLTEIKSSNDKRFNELVKDGVEKSNFTHYVQMQIYMGHTGLKRAMYIAVNKNDDNYYTERIAFDQSVYDAHIAKAESVIFSDEPPPRISEKPDWHECRFCNYRSVCHEPRVPEVSCRTCAHVTPEKDGRWSCAQLGIDALTESVQRFGCPSHRFIPILADKFATVVAADDKANWVQYELREQFGGGTFVNGPRPGLSSAEIRGISHPAILAHPAIEAIKAIVPAATLLPQPETP